MAKYREKYESEPILSRDENKILEPSKVKAFPNLFRSTGGAGQLKLPPIQAMNTEELNFDLAAFIASLTEECLAKDITPQRIQNLDFPSVIYPAESLSMNNVGLFIERPQEMVEKTIPLPKKMMPIEPSKPPSLEVPLKRESKSFAPTVEEKNIFRYKLRKRFGRQGRILIDKIFLDDELPIRVFTNEGISRMTVGKTPTLPSEVVEKIPHRELHDIYANKFKRYQEVYPFGDSDDDNDLQEFTKSLKKHTANNFRNFLKRKGSSSLLIS